MQSQRCNFPAVQEYHNHNCCDWPAVRNNTFQDVANGLMCNGSAFYNCCNGLDCRRTDVYELLQPARCFCSSEKKKIVCTRSRPGRKLLEATFIHVRGQPMLSVCKQHLRAAQAEATDIQKVRGGTGLESLENETISREHS